MTGCMGSCRPGTGPAGQAQGLLSRLMGRTTVLRGARDAPQIILMLFPPKQPSGSY